MHGTSIPPGFPVPPPETEPNALELLGHTTRAARRLELGAVVAQMYEIGYRSLAFSCVVLAFVGAIFVYQAGLQTLRVVPDMSGLDIIAALQARELMTRLVVLTMLRDELAFNRAMSLGVYGYVLKENAVTEIVNCLLSVAKGAPYVSPSLSGFLLRRRERNDELARRRPGASGGSCPFKRTAG